MLFAPSGAVRDPWKTGGIELLKSLELDVKTGQSLDAGPAPFAAGPPEIRIRDWNTGLDSECPALLPARGGFGSTSLLGDAPFARTARQAPLWIGSSDCTVLQSILLQDHGLVTFYGPMPCGQIAEPDDQTGRRGYRDALFGDLPNQYLAGQPIGPAASGTGELRGGCLTLLAWMCGTPWQLDGRDAILVIEDIGESPYRIQRMMEQLWYSGSLEGVRGLVFGAFPDCRDRSGNSDPLSQVLADWAERLDVPALANVPVGHGAGAMPIPLGISAQIDNGQLVLLDRPWM